MLRELSKILPMLETDVKSLGIDTKVLCSNFGSLKYLSLPVELSLT